jgi:hypothetical protein
VNETEKQIITQMIDEIILRTIPTAKTTPKYGGILYTAKPNEKESQFCGIFRYKNHVQLSISNDPVLKDPNGVLLGNGSTRRHINFKSPDEIDSDVVEALILQAAG